MEKKCHKDTQERGSQENEKMQETVIQTQTNHMEIGRKESESPFQQKEQSLLRSSLLRPLLILFIILKVIAIFVIASQYVYLELGRISRSWDLEKCRNGFVKLRFVGMYNPPV